MDVIYLSLGDVGLVIYFMETVLRGEGIPASPGKTGKPNYVRNWSVISLSLFRSFYI